MQDFTQQFQRLSNKIEHLESRLNTTQRIVVIESREPEDVILPFANAGLLKKAAQDAIQASFDAGESVAVQEGDVIYEVFPDGRKAKLKDVQPAAGNYQKGQSFSIE